MSKESFARWLNRQDEYYINRVDLRSAEKRHGIKVHTGAITVTQDDDGTTNIPQRDIRHGKWELIGDEQ